MADFVNFTSSMEVAIEFYVKFGARVHLILLPKKFFLLRLENFRFSRRNLYVNGVKE